MRRLVKWLIVQILTLEARLTLVRFAPHVIAITGSAGKTSTKDAIFAVLAREKNVRKSEKTYNNEFGVPLTILGEQSAVGNPFGWLAVIARGAMHLFTGKAAYPEWLVVEVGADHPGDVRRIARWLRPHIAVLTSIPDVPVHVEFFPSPEHLAREKRSIVEYLRPNGRLIVNGDDARTRAICAEFRGASVTFGFSEENDFTASMESVVYENDQPRGMRFRADRNGTSMPIFIPGSLGQPRIYSALAALAAAEAVDIDLVSASVSLSEWMPTPGRMRIVPGIRDSLILDDTYNSSPVAARAAVDTLASLACEERIAVLGDMLELGEYSAEAHRALGVRVAKCVDRLVTVGFRARGIAEAALDAGLPERAILQYEQYESERAGKELEPFMRKGVVVLVKGSQSMRMERTVKEIMAEPQHAAEMLVRQEPEWLARE